MISIPKRVLIIILWTSLLVYPSFIVPEDFLLRLYFVAFGIGAFYLGAFANDTFILANRLKKVEG